MMWGHERVRGQCWALIGRAHCQKVFCKGTKHLYSVRFTARELWGPDANPGDKIYVDMWDDYLEVP